MTGDFGMPGAIVHYVEHDCLCYPKANIAYRMDDKQDKNAGGNSDKYEKIWNGILQNQEAEEEIQNSVKIFYPNNFHLSDSKLKNSHFFCLDETDGKNGVYLIISNIVAISSVAIVTFDFSIKMFPPVIIYDGITRISL